MNILIAIAIGITAPIWIALLITAITYPACVISNLAYYLIYGDKESLYYIGFLKRQEVEK